MADDAPRVDMTTQGVVYRVPGVDRVSVERDLVYHRDDSGTLTFDRYSSSDGSSDEPRPAVVFVSGYPDAGMERMLGCKLKDMEAYVSWSRLVAASGLVAITYGNREPEVDLERLLAHLDFDAARLGIDAARIRLWACSGNVPNALAALTKRHGEVIDRALLAYGYMLDGDGVRAVSSAAAQFRFVNPAAGRTVRDLLPETELCVVRAGADAMPGLNASIDRFVTQALALDRRLTLINHAGAPHAFDLADDRPATHRVIRTMLEFLTG